MRIIVLVNACFISFSYSNSCPEGWTGKNCNKDIDECSIQNNNNNPCKHGGICINHIPGFECRCLDAYSGEFCENIKPEWKDRIGIRFSEKNNNNNCPNGK